jgi:hypothetical protein
VFFEGVPGELVEEPVMPDFKLYIGETTKGNLKVSGVNCGLGP